ADTVDETLQTGHVAQVTRLYVVQEPDDGGTTFVDNVRNRLAALRWSGVLQVIQFDGIKDVADLHADDPDRFDKRWRQALAAARTIHVPATPSGGVAGWADPVSLGSVPQ